MSLAVEGALVVDAEVVQSDVSGILHIERTYISLEEEEAPIAINLEVLHPG